MKAPVGAFVGIYYDGRPVAPGDCLRTPTGRVYEVVTRREQERGKHVGRQHLRCLVRSEAPAGAKVRRLHWYPRGRRRAG